MVEGLADVGAALVADGEAARRRKRANQASVRSTIQR
jgi:hypothetical protein